MRRRKPYVPKFKDGGAVPSDEPGPAVQDDGSASAILKKQIKDLEAQVEVAERGLDSQRNDLVASRVEFLKNYIIAGVPEPEVEWLAGHGDLIDDPVGLNRAAAAALEAGHDRGSPAYFEALRSNYDRDHDPDPVAKVLREARDPKPVQPLDDNDDGDYLASPSGNMLRVGRSRHIVSAPPSREVPSSDGNRQSDSRITLSAQQLEAAKISGISPAEYARQMLRLHQAKERGEVQS